LVMFGFGTPRRLVRHRRFGFRATAKKEQSVQTR
jgi:hypothetical protein